jgi:hypothetical protein
MADSARDGQIFHERQKPSHRPGGFDADDDRALECRIEIPDRVALVLQRGFECLACVLIQHGDRLLARV